MKSVTSHKSSQQLDLVSYRPGFECWSKPESSSIFIENHWEPKSVSIFIENWKASGGPHGRVVDISPSLSPRWGCHLCQGSSRHKRDNVNKMWNYGNCCLKTSTSHLQSPAHQHHTFCGCFLSPSIRAAWCSLIHNKGLGNLLSIPLLHEWLLSSVQDFSSYFNLLVIVTISCVLHMVPV